MNQTNQLLQPCQDVSDPVVRLNEKGYVMFGVVGDKPLAGAVATLTFAFRDFPLPLTPCTGI